MRLALLAVLLAPVLLAASAGADGGHDPREVAEQERAELNALKELAGHPPRPVPPLDAKSCGEPLDFDALAAAIGARGLPESLSPLREVVEHEALQYYSCRAFALQDLSACAPLKTLRVGTTQNGETTCRFHYNNLTIIRSLVTSDPGFPELCRTTFGREQTMEYRRPEDVAKACEIMRRDYRTPELLCSELTQLWHKKDQIGKCASSVLGANGDADGCSELDSPSARRRCLAVALFARSYGKAGISGCGDSPDCLALMGAGVAACEPFRREERDLFCGDISSGVRAQAASAGVRLRKALASSGPDDADLRARLSSLEAESAALARPLGSAASCTESFTLETALDRLGDAAQSERRHEMLRRAETYYTCRAIVAGGASACEPLKAAAPRGDAMAQRGGASRDPYLSCVDHFHDLDATRALIQRRPDAEPLCRDSISLTIQLDPYVDAKDVARVCALKNANYSAPEVFCAGMLKLVKDPVRLDYCPHYFRGLTGDAAACALVKPERSRARCLDYAAYARAFAAKDASVCGASAYCRALMGQGESSCAPLFDEARAAACAP